MWILNFVQLNYTWNTRSTLILFSYKIAYLKLNKCLCACFIFLHFRLFVPNNVFVIPADGLGVQNNLGNKLYKLIPMVGVFVCVFLLFSHSLSLSITALIKIESLMKVTIISCKLYVCIWVRIYFWALGMWMIWETQSAQSQCLHKFGCVISLFPFPFS